MEPDDNLPVEFGAVLVIEAVQIPHLSKEDRTMQKISTIGIIYLEVFFLWLDSLFPNPVERMAADWEQTLKVSVFYPIPSRRQVERTYRWERWRRLCLEPVGASLHAGQKPYRMPIFPILPAVLHTSWKWNRSDGHLPKQYVMRL